MAINATTKIIRADGIMTAPVDQEIVLLNMTNNNYVTLDSIGRRIWELLETPHVISDLCEELEVEFDASSDQIISDILPFLAELEREGLVRVVEQ